MAFGPSKFSHGFQIDWGNPLTKNLTAAFRFSEGGGTKVYDIARNRHHGTFLNTPTWSTGPRGRAVALTGTAQIQLANIPTGASLIGSTIICLFNSTSSANLGVVTIGDGSGSGYWGFGINALTPYIYVSGSTAPTGAAVSSGQWVHVAATFRDTQRLLYQNGVLKGSTISGWGPSSPSSRADIGSFGTGQQLQGAIDHVYLFARELKQSEIEQLYADPDRILLAPRKTFLTFITPVTGVGSFTFGAMTLAGAGTVVNPVTGVGSFTFDPMTLVGAGTVVNPVTGVGSFTFDSMTLTGAGSVVNPVTGVGSYTFDPMTISGAGNQVGPVSGVGSFTFAPMTISGAGSVVGPVTGVGFFTFDPMTISGTGLVVDAVTGVGSFTFGAMSLAGTGTVINPVTGVGSFTFHPMTVAAAGLVENPVAPIPGLLCPSRPIPVMGAGRSRSLKTISGAQRCATPVMGAGKAHHKWKFGPICNRVHGVFSTVGNFILVAAGRLAFRGTILTSEGSGLGTGGQSGPLGAGRHGFLGAIQTSENSFDEAIGGTTPFVTYSPCRDEFQLNFTADPAHLYVVEISSDETGPWVTHLYGLGNGPTTVRLNNDYRGNFWFRVVQNSVEIKPPANPDASIVEPPSISISNTDAGSRRGLWDNGGMLLAYNRHFNARINNEDWFLVPRERRRYSSGASPNYAGAANLVSVTGAGGAIHKWTRDGTDPTEATTIRFLDGVDNNAAAYRADFGYMIKARSFVGGCRSPMTCVLVDKELYETHNNVAVGEGQTVTAECDLSRTDNIRTDWSRDEDGNFLTGLVSWTFRSGNDCEDTYEAFGGNVELFVVKSSRDEAAASNSRTLSFQRETVQSFGGFIADYGTGDGGNYRSGFLWHKAGCSVFGAISGFAWTRTAQWDLYPPCYSNICVGFAGGGSAPDYEVVVKPGELTGPGGTTSSMEELASAKMEEVVKPLFDADADGIAHYDVYAYLTVHNDGSKPIPTDPSYIPPAEPPARPPVVITVNGDDFEEYLTYADATAPALNGGDGWSSAWVITDHPSAGGYEDFESYDEGVLDDGASLNGDDGWAGAWTFRTDISAIGQESFETYSDVRGMDDGTRWAGPWETRFSYFGATGGDDFEFYADANPAPATLESGELFRLPWILSNIGFFGKEDFEGYPDGPVTGLENGGEEWASAWVFSH